jgi:iron(III) transport system permease protein
MTATTAPAATTSPAVRPPGRKDSAARRRASTRRTLAQAPWILVTILVSILVLLPLLPLQWRAFENDAQGLRDLASAAGVAELFRTTVVLGLGAAIVAVVLGTALALAVFSMPPKLRSLFSFVPVVPMVIPGVAHVVGFVFLFSPENGYINTMLRATPFFSGSSGPINVYTPFWIIAYTGIHLAAFVYLFVFTGLQNVGHDHDQAARVSGAGGLRRLITVRLPMLRPTFLYSSVVVFMLALGQFTGPLILGRRENIEVVTTRMYTATEDFPLNYGLISALGTPLVVIAIILVVVQSKALGNQDRFVGRGDMGVPQTFSGSRWSRYGAVTFTSLFILLSAILPLLALVFVALSPFWTGNIDFSTLTWANADRVLADPNLTQAVSTSLWVSAVAIAIVIPIGMLVALALYNRDKLWRPVATSLDFLANLPLSTPAALIGFGFLFAYSLPWIGLAGTRIGLVLAYVTLMIPYAVRYQLAALVTLGRGTMEASRVCGATSTRTFGMIILPLCKRSTAASAAIVFVMLTHEFGVSLLLRSPDTTVMSVYMFQKLNTGLYPDVAVAALVMTVVTGVGGAIAMVIGGRKVVER